MRKFKIVKRPKERHPHSIDPGCTNCGLHKTAQAVCLRGRGCEPSDVMIVGEAPGFCEDDIGEPFSGKVGELLDRLLQDHAGLHRHDAYITNAVHCRPPNNRTPTAKEISSCLPVLNGEISAVAPKHVLVLGSVAMQATLGKSGISKHRGSTIVKDGINYFLTLHPAALFRQPNLMSYVESDFERFGKMVRGEIEGDGVLDYTIVNRPSVLRACLESLSKAKAVAYDLETSGLDPLEPGSRIYVLGLAQESKQWIIPLAWPNRKVNPWAENEEAQNKIIRALAKVLEGKKLIAHNGKFDNKWLRSKYNWAPPQTFDTMLASHILDENTPNGLKELSRKHFHAPDYGIDTRNLLSKNLREISKYCAYDVYYTLKLYELYREKLLEDPKLLNLYKQLIMPASRAMEEVELTGVYIDEVKYAEALKVNRTKIAQALQDLKEHLPYKQLAHLGDSIPKRESFLLDLGIKSKSKKKPATLDDFNWNSPAQVGAYLYGWLELPVLDTTETGNPSTAEATLKQLRDKHPVVPLLLEYRRLIKLQQFLESWGEHMVDGWMHPNFLLHGTVTGRLSCRNPNLQQVPRDTFLRSLITAPPGWKLVEIDYSQVELRVAAMLSGDSTMLRSFQTGVDVHSLTASKVSGIPIDNLTKEDRKKAKAVNFGFLYGMGWRKFKDYARDKYEVLFTDAESEQARNDFFELYNGLPAWHDRQRRLVKKYKQVRSLLGRIRHLPGIDSPDKFKRGEAERQAINSPVQGVASDMAMFNGLVRCTNEFSRDEVRVCGLVHDAVLGYVRDSKPGQAENLARKMLTIMEDMKTVEKTFDTRITVPIIAEAKMGAWGSGVEIKR